MLEVAPRLHGKDAPLVGDEPMVEEFRTPRGKAAYFAVRPGTNDHNTIFSCTTEDEYRLRDIELGDGWALDVGAYIGGVAIALALDNPDAHVIAVEALSVNVELLRDNCERNGVSDRVTILHAAAHRPGRKTAVVEWNFGADEAGQHHRFVGNAHGFNQEGAQREDVKALSLDAFVKLAGGEIAFAKVDCELCEYDVLKTPAVKSVALFRGEFHGGYDRIVELLGDTHDVKQTSGTEAFGGFEAVRR